MESKDVVLVIENLPSLFATSPVTFPLLNKVMLAEGNGSPVRASTVLPGHCDQALKKKQLKKVMPKTRFIKRGDNSETIG